MSGFFLALDLQAELLPIDRVVLRAALRDLEGADPVAECRALCQGPALFQAEQQRAAPGVATAGGIDDRFGFHRRYVGFFTVDPYLAPLRAERHDQAPGATRNVGRAPARAIAQHLALVVVDRHPVGLLDEARKVVTVAIREVVFKHALRNAAIPVVTSLSFQFIGLLSGAIVIDQVFALPGLGSIMLVAINGRDIPVVQGVVILTALLVIIVNLCVDLLNAWINPKVRS